MIVKLSSNKVLYCIERQIFLFKYLEREVDIPGHDKYAKEGKQALKAMYEETIWNPYNYPRNRIFRTLN